MNISLKRHQLISVSEELLRINNPGDAAPFNLRSSEFNQPRLSMFEVYSLFQNLLRRAGLVEKRRVREHFRLNFFAGN